MEKPTPFDLEPAIQNWRKSLSASPAIGNCDMDELESHLRDSIAGLQTSGLSHEEAFWVATNRLGGRDLLSHEFAKVNSERVWLDRILWMLIGSLGVGMVLSFAGIVGYSASFCLYKLTREPSLLGPANLIMFISVLLGVCVLIWCIAKSRSQTLYPTTQWAKAHPVAAVAILFSSSVLLTGTRVGMNILMAKTVPTSVFASLSSWSWPVVIISAFLWPAMLLWLVIKLAPKARKTA